MSTSKNPADYAFVVSYDEDFEATIVAIVPIEYFESTGFMYDQFMPVEDMLPDVFSSAEEGVYEFDGSVELAEATMEALGFKRHEGFTNFMLRSAMEDDK